MQEKCIISFFNMQVVGLSSKNNAQARNTVFSVILTLKVADCSQSTDSARDALSTLLQIYMHC